MEGRGAKSPGSHSVIMKWRRMSCKGYTAWLTKQQQQQHTQRSVKFDRKLVWYKMMIIRTKHLLYPRRLLFLSFVIKDKWSRSFEDAERSRSSILCYGCYCHDLYSIEFFFAYLLLLFDFLFNLMVFRPNFVLIGQVFVILMVELCFVPPPSSSRYNTPNMSTPSPPFSMVA